MKPFSSRGSNVVIQINTIFFVSVTSEGDVNTIHLQHQHAIAYAAAALLSFQNIGRRARIELKDVEQ